MKESNAQRIARKQREYKYAIYRTQCSIIGITIQIIGFILSVLCTLKLFGKI